MTDLINYLKKLHNPDLSLEDLHQIMDEVAVTLLRQTKIVTPGDSFYIREIEFYFDNGNQHLDPYAHCHKRQLEFGEWYFHRYTDIVNFKKSNRNGVDISFGSKDLKIYGGILLRKIQNAATGAYTIGINKVARALIDNVGDEHMNDLALSRGSLAFDRGTKLHLEVEGNNYHHPIYKTQRFGLTYKDEEQAKIFFKAPLCYYNHDLNVDSITVVRDKA